MALTVGVYDENFLAPNTVDFVAPGSNITNTAFAAEIASAFATNNSGVIDGQWLAGRYEYGVNQVKSIDFWPANPDTNNWGIGQPGSGRAISEVGAFATAGFAGPESFRSTLFAFGPILNGVSNEHVIKIGVTVLSLTGRDYGNVKTTAFLSGGGLVTASRRVQEANTAGDTFYGFSAPAGQYITSFEIAYDGLVVPDVRLWFDDIGFITGVVNSNNPPVSQNDTFFVQEDTVKTVVAPGVLGNDSDPESNTLTATLNSGPSNGSLVFNPDGSFVYTPNLNFSGNDSFTYTASDGTLAGNSATVSLIVTPVNDVPTLDAISDLNLLEDASQQSINLTGITAGGGESQQLRLSAFSNNAAIIPNPSISYISPAVFGVLRFTPIPNSFGSADVTIKLEDAGFDGVFGNADDQSVSRKFTVIVDPVNDLPTLNSVLNVTVNEDSPPVTVTLSGIGAGPAEAQSMRVSVSSSNPGLIDIPAINYTSPASTGSVQLTLLPDKFGSTVITVSVEDAGLDNDLNTLNDNGVVSKSFTLTVLPVQDEPYFDPVPDIVMDEDSSKQITLTGISTGGGEAQPLRIIAKTSVPGSFATVTTLYASPDSTGTIRLDALPNEVGTFFVSVVVEDGGGDANLDTPVDNLYIRRSFSVTILPVNDAPTIDPVGNVLVPEDSPTKTIDLKGISAGPGESELVRLSFTNSNPSLMANPVLTYTSPNSTGQFSFTPAANQYGDSVIVLTLTDAGPDQNLSTTADNAVSLQTFTITVSPINDPPTLDSISNLVLAEDASPYAVQLSGVSAGVNETQSLRITATSSNQMLLINPIVTYTSPNSTGTLVIVPQPDQSGASVIVVTVEDGGIDSDLTTTIDNSSITKSFTVTILPQNDAPTLNQPSNASIVEDASAQQTFLSGISAGPNETQPIRVSASSSNTSLIPSISVEYTSPSSTGLLRWAPTGNRSGTAVITVTVEDGGVDQDLRTSSDDLSVQLVFTITVAEANDAPSIDTPINLVIQEDSAPQLVGLTGISAGPGESQSLRVVVESSNPTLIPDPNLTYTSPSATGILSLSPVADQFGEVVISLTVIDPGSDGDFNTTVDNLSSKTSFTVTILPSNDSPSLDQIADVSVQEDTEVIVNLVGISPGNLESEEVRVSATSSNSTLLTLPEVNFTSPDSHGSIRLKPSTNQFGSSVITVQVEDAGPDNNFQTKVDNLSIFRTFTLSVDPVNDSPTLDPIGNLVIDEDKIAQITVTGITSGGGEIQPIRLFATSLNESLLRTQVVYSSPGNSGTVKVLTEPNMFGSASIVIGVTDGGLDNDLSTLDDNAVAFRTFSVEVSPVNDNPEIDPILDVVMDEDGQATIPLSGVNAGGLEQQLIRINANSSNPSLLQVSTIDYSSPDQTGSLSVFPAADQFGQAVVDVIVEDAGNDNDFSTALDNRFTTRRFTISVNPVNDLPQIGSTPDVAVDEDGQLKVNLNGISAGPGESQALQVTAFSANQAVLKDPEVLYISPSSTSELTLIPESNEFGVSVVTILVEDGGADGLIDTHLDNLTTSATFTVTVLPQNDSPTIDVPADMIVTWNSAQQTLQLTGITSGQGEVGSIRVTATSANLGVIVAPLVDYTSGDSNATLSFTTVSGQFGSAQIDIVVEDGGLDNDLDTGADNKETRVSLNVLVNAAPQAQVDRLRTWRLRNVDGSPLQNDTDLDGLSADLKLSIALSPPSTEGVVSVLDNRRIRFVPASGFVGVSSFSYIAADVYGAQSAATEVLVGVGKTRLQNPFDNLDVNQSGNITASDALLVINLLNDLSKSRLVDELLAVTDDVDINGDGRVSPIDALLVIDHLNASSGLGEGESQSHQTEIKSATVVHDFLFAVYPDSESNNIRRSSDGTTKVRKS
ncbi:MAG: Ig-like domain-containing protein [Pirellulales bacterium]